MKYTSFPARCQCRFKTPMLIRIERKNRITEAGFAPTRVESCERSCQKPACAFQETTGGTLYRPVMSAGPVFQERNLEDEALYFRRIYVDRTPRRDRHHRG